MFYFSKMSETVKCQQQSVYYEKSKIVRAELRKKSFLELLAEQETFTKHTCYFPFLWKKFVATCEKQQEIQLANTIETCSKPFFKPSNKRNLEFLKNMVTNYKKFVNQ